MRSLGTHSFQWTPLSQNSVGFWFRSKQLKHRVEVKSYVQQLTYNYLLGILIRTDRFVNECILSNDNNRDQKKQQITTEKNF